MNPDLQRLIELQRLDSTRHDAERRVAEEPERLRTLESRLEAARHAVATAKEQLQTGQAARRELEKEVAVHQGRLSKYRDQLMAVKTNQEYQAMQKEIEYAQNEIKALEDRVLERMLEGDDLAAAVKRAESELATVERAVEEDTRTLAADVAEMKRVIGRVAEARAALAGALNAKTLAMFDLVAQRRQGVAVAEAKDGICTICHVRLRPQVFNTVRRNDEIMQCDSCQRILYFASQTDSTAAQSSS